jgi:hypothetical protein
MRLNYGMLTATAPAASLHGCGLTLHRLAYWASSGAPGRASGGLSFYRGCVVLSLIGAPGRSGDVKRDACVPGVVLTVRPRLPKHRLLSGAAFLHASRSRRGYRRERENRREPEGMKLAKRPTTARSAVSCLLLHRRAGHSPRRSRAGATKGGIAD